MSLLQRRDPALRRAADLLNLTGVPMMGSVMDGMDMDAEGPRVGGGD